MLSEWDFRCGDPLLGEPEGFCQELADSSNRFQVMGKYRSFLVDPTRGTCTCGRTGGCLHREAVQTYLTSNHRQCPLCAGNGLRRLSRTDKHAVIGGEPVSHYECGGCSGTGYVSVRRRVALEAGLKRQRGRAA